MSLKSRVTVTAFVLLVAQLLVLYWPRVTVSGPVEWTDKVVHLLVFALPTYAAGRALAAHGRPWWLATVTFAAHAIISELIQGAALPERSGDSWDAVLNLVGVGLATLALAVAGRRSGVVRGASTP